MERKILKSIVAISLVITLTMANFILLGSNVVSYAIGIMNQTSETNNKNVKFTAYFKTADGDKTDEKEEKITSEDIKLYMEVSVQNEGYFNGEVEILNSNFKIKEQELSENINKIDGNKISLNQINSGETVEIEIEVETIQGDNIDSSLLNMESQIKLTGTYTDSTADKISVEGTKTVKLILEDPYEENEGAELEAEILTNKIYNIDGVNKRLVQVKVVSGLEGNLYPIKSTNLEVSVPEGVQEIKVTSIGTEATNGEEARELTEEEIEYITEENKLNIKIENEEQEGKIAWNKDSKDELVITYILPEDIEVEKTQITVKDKIELYNSKSTIKEAEVTVKIEEEKDGTIEIKSSNEDVEIYKGKIYAKQEREINTNVNIYVNYPEISDGIEVVEKQSTYLTDNNELTANVQYKTTEINKEEMIAILGQEGYITIEGQNGRQIAKITSNTEANEEGNIVIKYEDGIKGITIKTSAPENTGIIEIKHTKTIKAEEYTQETIKQIKTIKQNISATYNEITITDTNEINLKETTTKAEIEINKKSLTTVTENTDVEIKATLVTNNEKYDLYKNPTIKIELPSQVESINVNSINLLYEEELKIKEAKMTENNGIKTIEIDLEGEQTKYSDTTAFKGATIIINADIKLSEKSSAGNEIIKMTYTNSKDIVYENNSNTKEIEIEIVAPKEMVVINTMTNSDITAIGEEETQTKIIEIGQEAQQEEVTIEIINNNDAEVQDVKILGNFPTANAENTIETTITNEITTQGIDASKVQIYYSENENATAELTSENEWTETITDSQEVKSYLISVTSMEAGESLIATYGLEIPEDLEYNEQAYEDYVVTYTNTLTLQEETVQATTLGVSTGTGPELTATLKAYKGNEEITDETKVYAGEVIKYVLTIENTGTEDATNVKFEENVPENTTMFNEGYDIMYENGLFHEIPEYIANRIYEKIEVGEKIEDTYEVTINKDIQDNTSITNKISITSDQISTESNQNTITAQTSKVLVRILDTALYNEDHTLTQGYGYQLVLYVENFSDEDLKDVNIKLTTDDNYIVIADLYDDNLYEDIEIDMENQPIIKIGTLEKNSTIILGIGLIVSDDVEITDESIGYIFADLELSDNTYSSNVKEYTVNSKPKAAMQITKTSDTANQYLKDEDKITYVIKIKNTGEVDLTDLILEDEVPKILTILEVEKDGTVIQKLTTEDDILSTVDNDIMITGIDLKQNEETEISITALIEEGTQSSKTIKLTNTAEVIDYDNNLTVSSEEVVHYIEASSEESSSSESNSSDDNSGTSSDGSSSNSANTHTITGTVWLDSDKDGQRDSSEEKLSEITVELIDVETNQIVTNSSGDEIKTTTDDEGFYTLENVPSGKYIVIFEYDTAKYTPTTYQATGVDESKNSDAIINNMEIDGEEKTIASTDTITVNESKANIDLGLKEIETFSLELEKNISKITVQNSGGTKTYEYSDTTLTKIELSSKQMLNTNLVIEYEIKITNTGDAQGYVKSVVDYKPTGLNFSSELNTDWYELDGNLYNVSLANEVILPGESKTLTIIFTKTITSTSSQIINNVAEIAEAYSESGELSTTAGNKAQDESDLGSADIIISVSTGEVILNVTLITILTLIVIATGVYLINIKITKLKI